MRRKERESEMSTMAEDTQIELVSNSINGALIFHIVYDVLAFLLFMHQQIPSLLQDMTFEFDTLQTEYKELEIVLTHGELNASSRRKHNGRKRDVNLKIRRMERLMNMITGVRDAFKLLISELPEVEHIIFVFGASPRRPQHVYEICCSHRKTDAITSDDMARSRCTDLLSKKVIRSLISKGVGSTSYTGPSKLFLLVKAPASFSMPSHFLPKRDFLYPKKYAFFLQVVPLKLQLRSRTCSEEMDTTCASEATMHFSLKKTISSDEMWFQCRHVIKGLALGNPSPDE